MLVSSIIIVHDRITNNYSTIFKYTKYNCNTFDYFNEILIYDSVQKISVTHYFENLKTSQLLHIVRLIYSQLRGSWYFHFLYEINSSSLHSCWNSRLQESYVEFVLPSDNF